MKRNIFLLIIILSLPFSLLYAESTGLSAVLDMTSIQSEKGVMEVCFSQGLNNNITATAQTDETQCNYTEYDKITGRNQAFVLNIIKTDSEFYGHSPDNCFVNWKVYYNTPLDIIIQLDGPLHSTNTTHKINWQVSFHDPTLKQQNADNVAGTIQDGQFNYSTSEMLVHTTNTPNFGRSGSRALDIETQSLWGKDLVGYTGNIKAIIRTRG